MIEKIMEEIEEATRQEDAPIYCGNMEVDGYVRMSRVEAIIRQHMNDGWISVEERLPKEDGFYLVSLNLPTDDCEIKVSRAWFGEKSKTFSEYGKVVIAWQPLPEPYRPGKGRE